MARTFDGVDGGGIGADRTSLVRAAGGYCEELIIGHAGYDNLGKSGGHARDAQTHRAKSAAQNGKAIQIHFENANVGCRLGMHLRQKQRFMTQKRTGHRDPIKIPNKMPAVAELQRAIRSLRSVPFLMHLELGLYGTVFHGHGNL